MPSDYSIQVQTGMLVTGRKWCDFISYSGGLPMSPIRVLPDYQVQEAIVRAATAFETRLAEKLAEYHAALKSRKFVETVRRVYEEISI